MDSRLNVFLRCRSLEKDATMPEEVDEYSDFIEEFNNITNELSQLSYIW